jgi:hypothetical protein
MERPSKKLKKDVFKSFCRLNEEKEKMDTIFKANVDLSTIHRSLAPCSDQIAALWMNCCNAQSLFFLAPFSGSSSGFMMIFVGCQSDDDEQ